MKYYFMIFLFTLFALAAFTVVTPAEAESRPADLTAQAGEEESSADYLEQYEAWEKADREADLLKRGTMLIEFIKKYPQSILLPHVESSYRKALIECDQKEKYHELTTLADRWLEHNPGDLETIAYAVKAAEKLGDDWKRIQHLEEIYNIQPSGSLAIEIARAHKENKNTDKYIEWLGTAAAYPENAGNFILFYNIVKAYSDAQEYARAADNAHRTLKAADLVQDPSEETKLQLRLVRNACHHLIAMNLMESKKYPEAIHSFRQALEAERYGEGYYYIGQCLRLMDTGKTEDALPYFAKSEKQGGTIAIRAKAELETLYKLMHNNTLVGIEKIYRKADQLPD
jgi:tetratricopeptide (TPR) repeat protein